MAILDRQARGTSSLLDVSAAEHSIFKGNWTSPNIIRHTCSLSICNCLLGHTAMATATISKSALLIRKPSSFRSMRFDHIRLDAFDSGSSREIQRHNLDQCVLLEQREIMHLKTHTFRYTHPNIIVFQAFYHYQHVSKPRTSSLLHVILPA